MLRHKLSPLLQPRLLNLIGAQAEELRVHVFFTLSDPIRVGDLGTKPKNKSCWLLTLSHIYACNVL
jgi:hypothetical protein